MAFVATDTFRLLCSARAGAMLAATSAAELWSRAGACNKSEAVALGTPSGFFQVWEHLISGVA